MMKKKWNQLLNTCINKLESTSDDFCWSLDWDVKFFSKLIYEGFLTIATDIGNNMHILLPKLHNERCIINLDSNNPIIPPQRKLLSKNEENKEKKE